jgi:hypothetical protein
MGRHSVRSAYYVAGEGIVEEPSDLFGPPDDSAAANPEPPLFRFGRMFDQRKETIAALIRLAESMHTGASTNESLIPSGYTYLGQFIAHEITFDRTQDIPEEEPVPPSYRSPQIDLDSLYGTEPLDDKSRQLYRDDDPARLKIGKTSATNLRPQFENDLPRDPTGKALIGDERNDENLAVAQIHVAFIKFHNRVVERLEAVCPREQLLERAREQVVRHFQWLILNDYLKTILDQDVLLDVLNHGPKWFKVSSPKDLFMPLEFSAAAFRFGHSMVRPSYEWNVYHAKTIGASSGASLSQLFDQTEFSGLIGKGGTKPSLSSEWIIDWSRFFNLDVFGHGRPPGERNLALRIDTSINMDLVGITRFPHGNLTADRISITARNLLRGFALGLPTGEQVADWIGETPLTQAQIVDGREECFKSPALKGRTPLWFYVLKEAELNAGSRLGRVGSRIVAETLVGLIKQSRYSILEAPEWWPGYGRGEPGTNSAVFEMIDLLHCAEVINPIGG